MIERLTDAEVSELAEHADVLLNVGFREAAAVRALAAEVQQSRQRRCGNCAHLAVDKSYPVAGYCTKHWMNRRADWFCADFKAKP
jgi:hypothetical protein